MNKILLIIKGFFIGMAKIIPGVSGAVLAISLGIYEKLLKIIGHPMKINFDDLIFLFYLLIGAGGGILVFCWGIKWCLDLWKFATMLLFIGFIIGGCSDIISEIKDNGSFKNYLLFIISLCVILLFTNLSSRSGSNNNYFLMGCIESLTTIIPGISGTAIFMALGWYEAVLDTINSILTFNADFSTVSGYVLGFIFSSILISRFISYAFEKYRSSSYFCIAGFMIGSICTMFADLIYSPTSFLEIIIGVILFFVGFFSTNKVNSFFGKF